MMAGTTTYYTIAAARWVSARPGEGGGRTGQAALWHLTCFTTERETPSDLSLSQGGDQARPPPVALRGGCFAQVGP